MIVASLLTSVMLVANISLAIGVVIGGISLLALVVGDCTGPSDNDWQAVAARHRRFLIRTATMSGVFMAVYIVLIVLVEASK